MYVKADIMKGTSNSTAPADAGERNAKTKNILNKHA